MDEDSAAEDNAATVVIEIDPSRDKPGKIYKNFKHMAQCMFEAIEKFQKTKDTQKRLNRG